MGKVFIALIEHLLISISAIFHSSSHTTCNSWEKHIGKPSGHARVRI